MNSRAAIRLLVSGIGLVCILSLVLIGFGCRSKHSSSETGATPASVVVETDQVLTDGEFTYPHRFDIYRATNANKAIIFLHGPGDNKHHAAYQFGINLSDVDGDYSMVNHDALIDKRAMAVFPQGQSVNGAPEAATWTNYVTNSGQDDMKFIEDLVGYLSATYQVSRFYVVGHSTGGMLANRIWCEAADLFDAYVTIAGPPSEQYLLDPALCSPAEAKPYFAIVREDDRVLGVDGHWDDPTWTVRQDVLLPAEALINPVVISERHFLPERALMRCSEEVGDGDSSASSDGLVTTWSFCENSIRLVRARSEQGLEPLQDAVWRFLLQ